MSESAGQAVILERTGSVLPPRDFPIEADISKPDMLCTTCQSLFDDASGWHDVGSDPFFAWQSSHTQFCRPFRTRGDLRACAEEGCHLCTILDYGIEVDFEAAQARLPVKNEWAEDGGGIGVTFIDYGDQADPVGDYVEILLSCVRWFSDAGWWSYNLILYTRSTDPRYLFKVIHRRLRTLTRERHLISNHTGAQDAFAFMRQSLQECTSTHKCLGWEHQDRTDSDGRTLPKRLIDVGSSQETGIVRLVYGAGLQADAQYVTLSHRWGSDKLLTLTTATQLDLFDGYCVARFSKLLQDVIATIFKLGFRYLWLDLLCIQQDNFLDWETEAENLYNIYALANINISASFSEHNESLYCPRKGLLSMDLVVHPSWQDFPNKILQLEQEIRVSLEEERIASRGWVFQERLLSPRVLHFTRHQLVWECRKCFRSEDRRYDFHNLEAEDRELRMLANRQVETIARRDLLRIWMRLVNDYTPTVTTFEKDRLFAIAGIAAVIEAGFQTHSKGLAQASYFVGHWIDNLPLQLSWSIETKDARAVPRSEQYIAPTWSWASANGSVQLPIIDVSRATCLLDIPEGGIRVDKEGSHFGPAKKGSSLTVRCNLCRMQVEPDTAMSDFEDVKAELRLFAYGLTESTPVWDSGESPLEVCALFDDGIGLGQRHDRQLFIMPLLILHDIDLVDDSDSTQSSRTAADGDVDRSRHRPSKPSVEFVHLSDPDAVQKIQGSIMGRAADAVSISSLGALILKPLEHETTPSRFTRVGLLDINLPTYANSLRTRAGEELAAAFRNGDKKDGYAEVATMVDNEHPNVYLIEIF